MNQDLPSELHRHASALRSLARELLRCPHAADDVTQATLHQALARPDLRPGPLGGWLQRTLVNFARQWRRGERRRAARHAALAAPESDAEPRDALARREALRSVTNAVLSLDEPYQTAIFLRYFEDLPPRVIAQRTGANLATVKSRLARGLAMLRVRLDSDQGEGTRSDRGRRADWRLGLAATFGLGLPTSAAAGLTLTTGAWLVGTTVKTFAAAGALLAGGVLYYVLANDTAPEPSRHVTHDGTAAAAERVSAEASAPATAPEREQVTANVTASASWLDHPFPFVLEVAVVDDLGLPVANHSIRLSPDGCALDNPERSTDADGRLTLQWRGRTGRCRVAIEDGNERLWRLELTSGETAHLTLGTPPQGDGQPIRLTFTTVKNTLAGAPAGEPVVRSGLPVVGRMFRSGGLAMHAGLHPFAQFTDNAGRSVEAEASASGPELVLKGGSFTINLGNDNSRTLFTSYRDVIGSASATPQAAPTTAIAGTVFGEDGKPAAKVKVVVFGESPQPIARTETDEHGEFRVTGLAAGTFRVRAGGGPEGLATTSVPVTTGTTPATLQLQRGACVRGHVVDGDGKPIANARLVWQSLDQQSWDATSSGDDGAFCFANQPGGPGRVLCWPGDEAQLPLAQAQSVLPDTGDLRLVCDTAHGGALTLTANAPLGLDGRPQVRVWQLDTGASTVVPFAQKAKNWRLEHLPAGWYEVEVRAPGLGFVAAGRHYVDGQGTTDLGAIELPAPGLIRFDLAKAALPDEGRQFDVCALRKDMDVHLLLDDDFPTKPLQMPAGSYVVSWLRRDGTTAHRRFDVVAGETRTIAIGTE